MRRFLLGLLVLALVGAADAMTAPHVAALVASGLRGIGCQIGGVEPDLHGRFSTDNAGLAVAQGAACEVRFATEWASRPVCRIGRKERDGWVPASRRGFFVDLTHPGQIIRWICLGAD